MTVYTKDKVAKSRTAVLELLIKVGFYFSVFLFTSVNEISVPRSLITTDKQCVKMLSKLIFPKTNVPRFSEKQMTPVLLQIFEYVKYSTDITMRFVRKTSFQILVSHACKPQAHNRVLGS